jgi:hypothetical protein
LNCYSPKTGDRRKRFLERIDDPGKNWKFSVADDDKATVVSQIIVETLKDLKMSYAKTSVERHKEVMSIQQQPAI